MLQISRRSSEYEEPELAVQPEIINKPTRLQKCGQCCTQFIALLFSPIGLCCVLTGYIIAGAFMFQALEGPREKSLIVNATNVTAARLESVELLWKYTNEMNIFYPENWTAFANDVFHKYTRDIYFAIKHDGWVYGSDGEVERQWTFPGAMLYSITVITTIGYGHIAPKTEWGQVVTILYAIVGIPLTLLTLANLGGFMATAFRFIYKNICCGFCCMCCNGPPTRTRTTAVRYKENGKDKAASQRLTEEGGISPQESPKKQKSTVRVIWRHGIQNLLKTEDNKRVSVPIYVSLLLIFSYILLGAGIFTLWEDEWNFLIGSYFCFITLTTIGFGDYVPGTSADSWGNQKKLVLCSLYLLFGLSLIAMCFDLMQEEARNKCRYLGRKLGILKKDEKDRKKAAEKKEIRLILKKERLEAIGRKKELKLAIENDNKLKKERMKQEKQAFKTAREQEKKRVKEQKKLNEQYEKEKKKREKKSKKKGIKHDDIENDNQLNDTCEAGPPNCELMYENETQTTNSDQVPALSKTAHAMDIINEIDKGPGVIDSSDDSDDMDYDIHDDTEKRKIQLEDDYHQNVCDIDYEKDGGGDLCFKNELSDFENAVSDLENNTKERASSKDSGLEQLQSAHSRTTSPNQNGVDCQDMSPIAEVHVNNIVCHTNNTPNDLSPSSDKARYSLEPPSYLETMAENSNESHSEV